MNTNNRKIQSEDVAIFNNFCEDIVKNLESKDPDFFNRHSPPGSPMTMREKADDVRDLLIESARNALTNNFSTGN